MGYVFDGEVVPGGTAAKSQHRRLTRFLAVILFAFAAVFGIPIAAVAIISLVQGNAGALVLMAMASPLVLMCGWLGGRLWSDRGVPNWFVVSVMLIVSLAAFISVPLFVALWVGRAIDLAQ
jgi:hypothetical protein